MSGSPILAWDCTVIGVMCCSAGHDGLERHTGGGPNPSLCRSLPVWCVRFVADAARLAALVWQPAEGVGTVPNEQCYEAVVEAGKYRVAPWRHIDGTVGYEAFFISAGAKSMADVRDIAGSAEQGSRGLLSVDEARRAAEQDYASRA